jgi:hypothetical protein
MSFLVAATVLVGFVSVVNLILTIGVIRRLREHTKQLVNVGRASFDDDVRALRVGAEVGEFSATTVDGLPISRETFVTRTAVTFLTPGCEPCVEKLPGFVEYARRAPGGRDQVLAVVVGDAEEAADMVADLSDVALVVVERHGGPLTSAFQVTAYPVLLMAAPDEQGRLAIQAQDVTLPQRAVAV